MATIAQDAQTTVRELLEFLGIAQMNITATEGEEIMVTVTVPEDESGLLIGYHGEMLGALQHLVNQIVNKGSDSWTRIVININDYRNQRETQLQQMAQNAADRAVATGNEIEMPYLTPAERRVIHLALLERTDVMSFSEGEGRNRRLIVGPKKESNKG